MIFYYKNSVLASAVSIFGCGFAMCGLAMFSKRAVLCGENSGAHIFRSDRPGNTGDTLPTAVVEVLDPMVLASKIKKTCDCGCKETASVQRIGLCAT